MKKISVIVPVYGVEKYIRQCLESIVNQTYTNLEIIIVNDGTKDNSMEIVKEYLEDKRIIVINKENEGQSSARNAGLEIASGDYISFVDSDDWLELDLYANLMKDLSDEDIVAFDIKLVDNISKKVVNQKYKFDIGDKKEKVLKNIEIEEWIEDIGPSVWDKIYKKSFLNEKKLEFINGIICEDSIFCYQAYILAKLVKYKKIIGYNYRVNRENSIVYNFENKINESLSQVSFEKIIENYDNFLSKNNLNIMEELFIKLQLEIIKAKNGEEFDYKNLKDIIKNYFTVTSKKEKQNNERVRKYIKSLFRDKRNKIINLNPFEVKLWKIGIMDFTTLKRIMEKRLLKILKKW